VVFGIPIIKIIVAMAKVYFCMGVGVGNFWLKHKVIPAKTGKI
jgi:hypothetical protein